MWPVEAHHVVPSAGRFGGDVVEGVGVLVVGLVIALGIVDG